MKPVSARARGYRSYDHVEIDFPAGAVALVGANGAGKSSLVELIPLCLFGAPGRSLADYVREGGDGELEIELTFEHAGELFRVRRSFSARGRGKSTTDFEVWRETDDVEEANLHPFAPTWQPLTREDQKATQALIEAKLGFSRDTFVASSFLSQGQSGVFCDAPAGKRKQILGEILGLGVYDRIAENARDRRKAAGVQIDSLTGKIAGAEAEAAMLDGTDEKVASLALLVAAAAADLVKAERELEDAQVRWQDAEGRASARRAAQAELDAVRARLATAEGRITEANQLRLDEAAAMVELAKLPAPAKLDEIEAAYARALAEWNQAADARKRLDEEIDRLEAEQARLTVQRHEVLDTGQHATQRLVAVDDDDSRCDACGQPLSGDAAKETLRERYRSEIAASEGRARALYSEWHQSVDASLARQKELQQFTDIEEPAEAPVIEARRVKAQRMGLEERISQLGERRRSVDEQLLREEASEADAAVGIAEKALASLPEISPLEAQQIQTAHLNAKARVIEERQRGQNAREQLAAAKVDQERLHRIRASLTVDTQERDRLTTDRDRWQQLEQHAGRNGVQVAIVENVIPQIEAEAQQVLARLGGETAGAVIELRTQRANKTNDNLAETLDIVMRTEDGYERAYEFWSGGEKQRLALALRVGLALCLETRRGANSDVFVLDEPGDLDAQGKSALVEILREIHERGVSTVVLISHDTDLRDAFDTVIEVEAGEGGSRIVGAVPAEAVAA